MRVLSCCTLDHPLTCTTPGTSPPTMRMSFLYLYRGHHPALQGRGAHHGARPHAARRNSQGGQVQCVGVAVVERLQLRDAAAQAKRKEQGVTKSPHPATPPRHPITGQVHLPH